MRAAIETTIVLKFFVRVQGRMGVHPCLRPPKKLCSTRVRYLLHSVALPIFSRLLTLVPFGLHPASRHVRLPAPVRPPRPAVCIIVVLRYQVKPRCDEFLG